MMRGVHAATDALSVAVGVTLGGLILGLFYNNSDLIPLVDGAVLPVIHFDPTTRVYRERHDATYTTGRICFDLNMVKLRDATPLPYRFRVSTEFSPEIGIAVNLANADNSRAPSQNYGRPHAAGQHWIRRYCGELPGTVGDDDQLVVTGTAYHRRHRFWTTATPIPPFLVDAAPKS